MLSVEDLKRISILCLRIFTIFIVSVSFSLTTSSEEKLLVVSSILKFFRINFDKELIITYKLLPVIYSEINSIRENLIYRGIKFKSIIFKMSLLLILLKYTIKQCLSKVNKIILFYQREDFYCAEWIALDKHLNFLDSIFIIFGIMMFVFIILINFLKLSW